MDVEEDLESVPTPNMSSENHNVPQSLPHPAQLDWESPDDPANPLNWSTSKKMYQLIISSLMGFST